MDYKYDVFISYRRDPQTLVWIKSHFIPVLTHSLKLELGHEPNIFIDEQMEIGDTWPISMENALGDSKIIILLWTRTFLHSIWCASEVAHMRKREDRYEYRTNNKPDGLIFPFIIHDGDTIPKALSIIQQVEIQECFNIRMSEHSHKAEMLVDKFKEISKPLAQAITNAPTWEKSWKTGNILALYHEYFNPNTVQQTNVPKFISNE